MSLVIAASSSGFVGATLLSLRLVGVENFGRYERSLRTVARTGFGFVWGSLEVVVIAALVVAVVLLVLILIVSEFLDTFSYWLDIKSVPWVGFKVDYDDFDVHKSTYLWIPMFWWFLGTPAFLAISALSAWLGGGFLGPLRLVAIGVTVAGWACVLLVLIVPWLAVATPLSFVSVIAIFAGRDNIERRAARLGLLLLFVSAITGTGVSLVGQ